ncbi:MAG: glycosyltransferase family A protein [Balneola sp.]
MGFKASVIVRSYNRIPALLELLTKLRAQTYNDFEIVVVEQSTKYVESDWGNLTKVCEADQRIKLFKYEPLGGPKARNQGVKNASGDILIFVDDDDLPNSKNWISQHVEAYQQDEKLVGFTGRHIFEGNEKCPYVPWMRWFIRRSCMSYNWLKFPYTFAQFDEDVNNVEWLHGTNSSIRREWAIKAGLWDAHVSNQDEHSFAFKLQPLLVEGYHLDFKKEPALIRRMNVEGGMGKRSFSLAREWKNQYLLVTKVILRYHPKRIILYPFMLLWILFKTLKKSLSKLF